MIRDHDKENSRDVLFGHGSVIMHRCHFADEPPTKIRVLMLRQDNNGHAVGEVLPETDPSIGVPSDAEPERPTVKLIFDNVAGLDALVAELNMLKVEMTTEPK